jgi:hypothetical protein
VCTDDICMPNWADCLPFGADCLDHDECCTSYCDETSLRCLISTDS